MKRKLILMLIAAGAVLSAQVSVGIRIGAPPPMRMQNMNHHRPGAEFIWVDGYWYPERNHYEWQEGYWTRAPFAGARWVAPFYDGRAYINGSWTGDRDRFAQNRRFNNERDNYAQDRRYDNDRDGDRYAQDRRYDNDRDRYVQDRRTANERDRGRFGQDRRLENGHDQRR